MVLSTKVAPKTLLLLASFMAAIWVFIEVAEEVMEGDIAAFDRGTLLMLRLPDDPATPLGPIWLESVARDITALGSVTVLGMVVASVTIFLLLAGKTRASLFVMIASLGGALIATALKAAYDRPRPNLFSHGDLVLSASFPSGHAMISAVVYLTLGALLARLVRPVKLKIYVMSLALSLTFIVGLSRIYLGVHWPTDVLAGWIAGAGWALGCWGVADLFHVHERSHR